VQEAKANNWNWMCCPRLCRVSVIGAKWKPVHYKGESH